MSLKQTAKRLVMCLRAGAVGLAVLQMSFGQVFQPEANRGSRTPIKHVIIIVGENRTFDHLFATYKPKAGERYAGTVA
jgi:phospholipase C